MQDLELVKPCWEKISDAYRNRAIIHLGIIGGLLTMNGYAIQHNPSIVLVAAAFPPVALLIDLFILRWIVAPWFYKALAIEDHIDVTGVQQFELTAPDLTKKEIHLNGRPIVMDSDSVPKLPGQELVLPDNRIELRPCSYSFLSFFREPMHCRPQM